MKTSSQIYDVLMENYLLLVESDRQFFARFHLSQVRYFAILHISQNPEISLTELSKKLLCTKGNTTRIIQGMVTDDLLTVTKDQDDQRAMKLNLTEKGKHLLQLVKREFDEFNQTRFTGVGANPEQLIELNTNLKARLENNLKKT
jgi:DNA-binding MarR family transcriptional regulator